MLRAVAVAIALIVFVGSVFWGAYDWIGPWGPAYLGLVCVVGVVALAIAQSLRFRREDREADDGADN